jgi:hypothetical protein
MGDKTFIPTDPGLHEDRHQQIIEWATKRVNHVTVLVLILYSTRVLSTVQYYYGTQYYTHTVHLSTVFCILLSRVGVVGLYSM